MATLSAPATQVSARPERSAGMKLERILVPLGVTVAALGMAVLLVLPPIVLHPLLDAAGSARFLGITPAEAHRLSDLTVAELVFGPGTFAIAGPDGAPLYDASEIGHLSDARVLLYGFLAIASLGALGVIASVARVRDEGRRQAWSRVSRSGLGLAVGIAILGVVALLAFEPAFELFHRIFFPGGNYSFDPRTQRLVQLYPLPFWQLVSAAVGAIAAAVGLALWWGGRRRSTVVGRG